MKGIEEPVMYEVYSADGASSTGKKLASSTDS